MSAVGTVSIPFLAKVSALCNPRFKILFNFSRVCATVTGEAASASRTFGRGGTPFLNNLSSLSTLDGCVENSIMRCPPRCNLPADGTSLGNDFDECLDNKGKML